MILKVISHATRTPSATTAPTATTATTATTTAASAAAAGTMDDDEAFECRPCGAEAAPLRTLDTALRRETTQRAASASALMDDARTAISVVQQKHEVQCSAACKNHRAQFHAKHGKPKGCNHLPSCPKKLAAQKMRQKGN